MIKSPAWLDDAAVQSLNNLRRALPALKADAAFRFVHFGTQRESMVFIREGGGQRLLIAIHFFGRASQLKLKLKGCEDAYAIWEHKMKLKAEKKACVLSASGTGFGIYDISH